MTTVPTFVVVITITTSTMNPPQQITQRVPIIMPI